MAERGKHFKPKGEEATTDESLQAQRDKAGAYSPQNNASSAAAGVQPVVPLAGGVAAGSSTFEPSASSPYEKADAKRHGAKHGRKNSKNGDDGNPKRRKRDWLSTILITVGVVLLLVAGGLYIHAQIGYKQASDYYDNIKQTALTESEGSDIPKIDWDALHQINSDIIGWIYIPNTQINYAVLKGKDNEQYLYHLPNGTYNPSGSIFMDAEQAAPGVVDQQTTLYGHHMNDSSMFNLIDHTTQQDVFDTVGDVYYLTEGKTYVFKPMFTMLVEDTYTDARIGNFGTTDEFRQYLQASLAKAKASSENAASEVEEAEQVLTLVTCSGEIIPRTTRAGMVCRLVDSYDN